MPTPRVASSRQDDLLPLGGAGSLGSRVDQTWTEKESGKKKAKSAWHALPRNGRRGMRGLRSLRGLGGLGGVWSKRAKSAWHIFLTEECGLCAACDTWGLWGERRKVPGTFSTDRLAGPAVAFGSAVNDATGRGRSCTDGTPPVDRGRAAWFGVRVTLACELRWRPSHAGVRVTLACGRRRRGGRRR